MLVLSCKMGKGIVILESCVTVTVVTVQGNAVPPDITPLDRGDRRRGGGQEPGGSAARPPPRLPKK